MNERDTSSYGDTPMCQIISQCQTKKKVMVQTRICTDRRTDRQRDSVIHINPIELLSRGV